MAAKFQTVALLAATGNLGSKILRSLSGAGFNVTAVQRKGSSKTLPEGVKSVQADLTSKADLIAVFKGQDVVVSAVPMPNYNEQIIMFEAAVEAGVKRVMPSEFSSNLEAKVKETKLPNVSEKLEIREYIESLANQGKIEWSSVNNGPFFDLGMKMGFMGPRLQSKTATFHNGGDIPVCATSTDDIAKAVALVLQHPDETRNKPVYVYSALVTERKVTDIASKLTGIEFKIVQADIQKGADEYFEKLEKGENDPRLRFNLYFLMMYGPGYGGNYADIAMNKMLGLRVMDNAEIERKIGDWLEDAGVEVRR